MKTFKFKGILQNQGWTEETYIQVDDRGIIQQISQEKKDGTEIENVHGYALPGFQNAHSHAFQYAMAGLAERHEGDDFWAWREAMYKLALSLSPDQMEAIATMLYAEMLRHGYTHVAEFHYLHHDVSGKPYRHLAEMGERLISAAKRAGIKIMLIPIFYQKGGFGQEAQPGQRRFLSRDVSDYLKLFEASRALTRNYSDASVGYGAHSLRAVGVTDFKMLSQMATADTPIHMHVSEQKQEVKDSVRFLGLRPVEWLAEHINLGACYHLIHATHLTREESQSISASGAHVVLCPSTEGNLGDGRFPLLNFIEDGGKWSIGTDSHVGLNPFEELRILDYGQRINSHSRNTFLSGSVGDNGHAALSMSLMGGRRAMGNKLQAFFTEGEPLDALVLDANAPLLSQTSLDNLSSTIVYASDASMHYGTLVNGEWKVKEQRHVESESIRKSFAQCMKTLKNR